MDADDITTAYDKGAARYDTSRTAFFQPVARHLIEHTGITEGMNVLDVGCGAGAATVAAASAVGPAGTVTAIDTSPAMLDRCRATVRGYPMEDWVSVRSGDASERGLGARYDAIVASMLVFMLPDLPLTLHRWSRRLHGSRGRIGFSWRVSSDPRWAPAIAAVDQYLPAGTGSWEQYVTRPPFSDLQAVAGTVRAAGYREVVAEVREQGMRFASPEEWWDAVGHTGYAAAWQHITGPARAAAKAEAMRLLEEHRETDGSISRVQAIGYLRAFR